MNNTTMTVHEALAELKVLDSRIDKKIHETTFAIANKKSNSKINGKTVAEVIDNAGKNFQSITDLLNRRSAIRAALSKSNAETKINIAGTEYSVAEAIEMKKSGIQMWTLLNGYMSRQLESAKDECNRTNGRLDDKADMQVSAIFGTKEKVTTAEAMAMRDAYIEANKLEPVTMKNLENEIEKIQDKIDAFTVEVDSKLSVSNALTTITIEY